MGIAQSQGPGSSSSVGSQYATPATGTTVTVLAGTTVLQLNPAGTLATLTVDLTAVKVDGHEITISTTQILTALTISGGTIVGTLTTLAVAGFAKFKYNATADKFFRVG
jgi:hypothetical protein